MSFLSKPETAIAAALTLNLAVAARGDALTTLRYALVAIAGFAAAVIVFKVATLYLRRRRDAG